MPARFRDINEIAAKAAIPLVRLSAPEQDKSSIANGARVTSEVILRTMGRFGIELPEGFGEQLRREFIYAEVEDDYDLQVRRERIAEMESGGI